MTRPVTTKTYATSPTGMTRREAARMWQAKADEAARQLLMETDPRRARLLELGVAVWGCKARDLRRMTPAKRRRVATTVLCGSASGLFLGPAALAGGLSPELMLAGAGGPAAIVAVIWAVVIFQRMPRDADTRTTWRPNPDRADEEVGVR